MARPPSSPTSRADRRAILRDVSLALLESALGATPIDEAEIRTELAVAHRMGFDWRALYQEALLRRRRAGRPVPAADEVAPEE
jgi:hypothetical protein